MGRRSAHFGAARASPPAALAHDAMLTRIVPVARSSAGRDARELNEGGCKPASQLEACILQGQVRSMTRAALLAACLVCLPSDCGVPAWLKPNAHGDRRAAPAGARTPADHTKT